MLFPPGLGNYKTVKYQFRPQLLPTLAAVLLIAVMIKLGFWQYGKAEQKRALQETLDARLTEAPVGLPARVEDAEAWRYRRVQGRGVYDARYQILLDNQVDGGRAGYHVITPFRAAGSETLVLVDRGWIPTGDRSRLPEVETPQGEVEMQGSVWVPSTKYYELAAPTASTAWQTLWQNMDMTRYARSVPHPVLPFVVRLDPAAAHGFVRNWPRPAERIETHIGYAWQWWGFSATLALIWLFVNFRRRSA
jgi:surfeit locus 1 family protein